MHFRVARLLISLALITTPVAAYATPACWPSLTMPPKFGELPDSAKAWNGTHWAAWKCGEDVSFVVFTVDEARPVVAAFDAAASAMGWQSVGPLNAAQRFFAHGVAVDYFGAQPMALYGVAYKRRVAIDGYSYVRVGTVPMIPCQRNGERAGDYMIVSRDSVKMDSRLAAKPTDLYAVCG